MRVEENMLQFPHGSDNSREDLALPLYQEEKNPTEEPSELSELSEESEKNSVYLKQAFENLSLTDPFPEKIKNFSLCQNPKKYHNTEVILLQLLAMELIDPSYCEPQSVDLFFWQPTKIFHHYCMEFLSHTDPSQWDKKPDDFARLKDALLHRIKVSEEREGVSQPLSPLLAHLVLRSFSRAKLFKFYDVRVLVILNIFSEELKDIVKEYYRGIKEGNFATLSLYSKELESGENSHFLGINDYRFQISLQTFLGQLIRSNMINTAQIIHNFFYIVKKIFDEMDLSKRSVDPRIEMKIARALLLKFQLQGQIFQQTNKKSKEKEECDEKQDPEIRLMIRFLRAAVQMDIFTTPFNRPAANDIRKHAQQQPKKWRGSQTIADNMEKERQTETPENEKEVVEKRKGPYESAYQVRYCSLLKIKLREMSIAKEPVVWIETVLSPEKVRKKLEQKQKQKEYFQSTDGQDLFTQSARNLFLPSSAASPLPPARRRAKSLTQLVRNDQDKLDDWEIEKPRNKDPKPKGK